MSDEILFQNNANRQNLVEPPQATVMYTYNKDEPEAFFDDVVRQIFFKSEKDIIEYRKRLQETGECTFDIYSYDIAFTYVSMINALAKKKGLKVNASVLVVTRSEAK